MFVQKLAQLAQLASSKGFDSFVFVEGHRVNYSEVSSTFSKLVETHFLQRCPPPAGAAATDSSASSATRDTPAPPSSTTAPTPESFPDCYKVPQVTLIRQGKRKLATEDGEEQRSEKRAKMDPEVGEKDASLHPSASYTHLVSEG